MHLSQAARRRASLRASIDRSTFEELIRQIIEGTVQQTLRMLRRAEELGFQVDTVLLVGGSPSIPLVRRLLEDALPVAPKRTQHQDVAVALGAAYYGQRLWGSAVNPKTAKVVIAHQDIRQIGGCRFVEIYFDQDRARLIEKRLGFCDVALFV